MDDGRKTDGHQVMAILVHQTCGIDENINECFLKGAYIFIKKLETLPINFRKQIVPCPKTSGFQAREKELLIIQIAFLKYPCYAVSRIYIDNGSEQ